jgi:hypothetical protein
MRVARRPGRQQAANAVRAAARSQDRCRHWRNCPDGVGQIKQDATSTYKGRSTVPIRQTALYCAWPFRT